MCKVTQVITLFKSKIFSFPEQDGNCVDIKSNENGKGKEKVCQKEHCIVRNSQKMNKNNRNKKNN